MESAFNPEIYVGKYILIRRSERYWIGQLKKYITEGENQDNFLFEGITCLCSVPFLNKDTANSWQENSQYFNLFNIYEQQSFVIQMISEQQYKEYFKIFENSMWKEIKDEMENQEWQEWEQEWGQ